LKLYHRKNYKETGMEKIEYFDYQRVSREMKVSGAILKKIEKEVKEEFPKD
jgi:hypothetical protein